MSKAKKADTRQDIREVIRAQAVHQYFGHMDLFFKKVSCSSATYYNYLKGRTISSHHLGSILDALSIRIEVMSVSVQRKEVVIM
jgi:hypothetical protein